MRITQAILKTFLSVFSLIHDYHSVDDVCFSPPTIVDRGGVEQVLRLTLDDDEIEALRCSGAILQTTIASLELG